MNRQDIETHYLELIRGFQFPDLDVKLSALYAETFSQAQMQYGQGNKQAIAYSYLSCMRVDWDTQKLIFRLDLYDERWLLDPMECSGHLDCSDFIVRLVQAHQNILQKSRQYGLDFLDMQRIWRSMFGHCLKKITPHIEHQIVSFAKEANYTSVRFYMGEYFDRTVLVFGESA